MRSGRHRLETLLREWFRRKREPDETSEACGAQMDMPLAVAREPGYLNRASVAQDWRQDQETPGLGESHYPPHVLAAYIDGSLGEPERARLSGHLESCRACRDQIEFAKSLMKESLAGATLKVPDHVSARTCSTLDSRVLHHPRKRPDSRKDKKDPQ